MAGPLESDKNALLAFDFSFPACFTSPSNSSHPAARSPLRQAAQASRPSAGTIPPVVSKSILFTRMSTKEFEHAYYIGNYMSGILYGIEFVMYTVCMNKLLFSKRHRRFQSSRLFLSVFSTLLFILVTIDISTNAVWGEQMWITFRDEPGGVPLFIETQVSVWYETLSSTSVVAMIFMGDALLIYRLYIIYDSNLWLVVIPCLTWCTALALAIIQLVISGTPGGNFFNGITIDFGTPYYALTISMNVVITSLICFRLLYYSQRIKRILGAETAKTYTGVAAILIESAAPYSLVGLMFLIPYTQKSGTAIAFGQVWAKMTCLSPQLIILRVTSGTAWGKDTLEYHSRNTPGGTGRGIGSGPDGDKSEVMTTGLEFSPISEDGGQSAFEPESPVFAYGAEKGDELKTTKSKSTIAYSSTAYTEKTSRNSDK